MPGLDSQHGLPPKRERETDKETGIETNKTVSHTDPGPSVLTDSDMGCTETYIHLDGNIEL